MPILVRNKVAVSLSVDWPFYNNVKVIQLFFKKDAWLRTERIAMSFIKSSNKAEQIEFYASGNLSIIDEWPATLFQD